MYVGKFLGTKQGHRKINAPCICWQIHPFFAVLCLHVQKHSTTVGVVDLSTSRARACLPAMNHHSSQAGFDEEAQSDLRSCANNANHQAGRSEYPHEEKKQTNQVLSSEIRLKP